LSIVIAVIALGLLVLIHEGGHFLAARLCKVAVLKFSIGFGPKLFSFFKHGTEFTISLIPLGGYVKMKGDDPDLEKQEGEPDEYYAKKWYQRAFIVFAGPFANLIFALILFIFASGISRTYRDYYPIIHEAKAPFDAYFQQNDQVKSVNSSEVKSWSDIFRYTNINENNEYSVINDAEERQISIAPKDMQDFYNGLSPITNTVIGEVSPGLPAWKAGLKKGDKILEIQGKTVSTWYEVRDFIKEENSEIELLIERDKKTLKVKLLPEENPLQEGNFIVGISQELPLEVIEKNSVPEAIKYGSISTANFVAMNYYAIYKLFKNPKAFKNSIGGPVMVFSMTKESSEKGLAETLNFIAAISILLMIMNLLPIPVLDGGHILFCFIEGIMQKRVSMKIQMYAQQAGFFLLMLLMVYAFANDFSKLANRAHSNRINQKYINQK